MSNIQNKSVSTETLERLKNFVGELDWQIEGENAGFSFIAKTKIAEFFYHVFSGRYLTPQIDDGSLFPDDRRKVTLSQNDAINVCNNARRLKADICERLLNLVVKIPQGADWFADNKDYEKLVLEMDGRLILPDQKLQKAFIAAFNDRIGIEVEVEHGRCCIDRSQLARAASSKITALLHERLG